MPEFISRAIYYERLARQTNGPTLIINSFASENTFVTTLLLCYLMYKIQVFKMYLKLSEISKKKGNKRFGSSAVHEGSW